MEQFNKSQVTITEVNEKGLLVDSLGSTYPHSFSMSPLVYILYNKKYLYVGETTNLNARFINHNQSISKQGLSNRIIIHSEYFNKSVALQLESFLIKHFSGDGKLTLLNGNNGLGEHNYYKKSVYESVFPEIWKELKDRDLAKQSVNQINNSDLFKYSPYKALNIDQQEKVIIILEGLLDDRKNFFVNGGAGTGKTILAIYLMKLLSTPVNNTLDELEDSVSIRIYELVAGVQKKYPNLATEIALVVPMTSLRGTLRKVFRNINNLSAKMVIGPTDASKSKYTLLIVDEAHRLSRRKNISYMKAFDDANRRLDLDLQKSDQLDWITKVSESRIFFYDEKQSIKPSDIPKSKWDYFVNSPNSLNLTLVSQIRSKGGDLYSTFIDNLLNHSLPANEKFDSNEFEFLLVDKVIDLKNLIVKRDAEAGLSRIVAGFAWEWISEDDKTLFDIKIENTNFQWNSTTADWINSKNALNEVGCIHTTQGYDLNYVGIIFGNEIGYDSQARKLTIKPENYKDRSGKTGSTAEELKANILNIYRTLMLRGIKGVYIYCCDAGLKAYFRQHMKSW
jgi:DUF2075 family protein/predicted GIY-YIG superfamily endonuclease